MMKTVRWGILGIGLISRDYMIPALLHSEVCKLVAYASFKEQPKNFLPTVRREESYEALLAAPDIDAIYIPLPNALHTKWAIDAMRHGKHVLCEKPMACTRAEVEQMCRAAEENHVYLMEAFMYRYGAKFQKVSELLNSGVIGELRAMQGTHGYVLNWKSPTREEARLGGGCLFDVGCYVIDCMQHFVKEPISQMQAVYQMQGDVDWNTAAVLRFENGVVGSLGCWFNSQSEQRMMFSGDRGVMIAPDLFEPGDGQVIVKTDSGTQTFEVKETLDPYQAEAEAFSRAILGEKAEWIPLEESLRNAQTLEKLILQRPVL